MRNDRGCGGQMNKKMWRVWEISIRQNRVVEVARRILWIVETRS
jgi:hypothetical protein